ncbi:hypothetical protein J2X63_002501 [Agromyces sp. 3263]|uniref:DUF6716 putative glycosyltransferase n=1 Tax=Agromyces sp. 3263 TaxID=2817750 RepID=UPI0028638098|nr:DUF6716 putative glycosyltransferase [Agromyces sp. 3263]MDR6906815.1 hypothetical protein [Agromyces sp. 3263]
MTGGTLLVVADTDSYVKWGAALASQLPDEWEARLVVVATPAQPSARQLRVALAGTRFAPADVAVVELDALGDLVDGLRPDAVLLALRGPLVRVVVPVVGERAGRPVIATGFPGLTIPAARKAVIYRERTDLIVLHSRREVREFRAIADELGVPVGLGLATLPFLRVAARELEPAAARSRPPAPAPNGPERIRPERTDLVFAAQAKVPSERDDRVRLLGWLADAARRRPNRRVVVKVRARAGEAQTHAESWDYADLLADPTVRAQLGGSMPPNLVVEDGPMAEHLARASALVTVSSTAVLEAIAEGVPALVVDEFGVGPRLINTVFVGSGLFGGADDVAAGAARDPDPAWLDDNYFHGPAADDWLARLVELVERRRVEPLPLPPRRHNRVGGAVRRAYERRRMLGPHDRSPGGAAAMVVALPVRWVVRRMHRVRAALATLSARP